MALGFWRRMALTTLLVCGAAACSEELEGPQPSVEPPALDAEPLPADPGIVCRDQLTTEVTLHGEGFSPIPIDIPGDPKLALPDIELSRGHELDGAEVGEPELIIWSGDPDADPTNAFASDGETPRVFWKSQREMSFVIDQELTLDAEGGTGMLPEGVYDVTVGNANGALATTPSALAVVERPEVSDFSPGITCLEQGGRNIDFNGRTFLRNGSDEIVLEVEGVDTPFPVSLNDCTDVAHEGIDAAFCNALTVDFDESAVEVGFPAMTLRNPETAACSTTEDLKLRVVPPPAIDRVVPPMGCVAEGSRSFTIEGAEFLRIDGQTPHVALGSTDFAVDAMDGCESVETQGHEVERCTSLTITVDMDELAPDLYELTVVNPDPAGCDNVATGALRIVPPPSIDVISPALVCLADSERVLNVDGSDYLIVDGEIPAVRVDGEALDVSAISPESCEDLEVDGLSVQKCDRLVVTLAQDGVSLGMGDLAMPLIEVENPQPAGCSDESSSLLSVIDRPTASDLDPGILCIAQGDRTLTIAGQTLLRHDDREPVLEVEGVTDPFPVGVSDCTAIEQPDLDAALCDTGTVTLPMASIADGFPALTVLNPQDAGCRSVDDRKLRLVPPPSITRVVEPLGCLAEGARQFVIEGADFLRIDDVAPAVTVGTVGFAVDAMAGCSALETQGHTVELCSSITITIADTDLAPELYTVTVENPAPAGCDNVATGALRIAPPPDITDVQPALVCLDDGTRDITITGTDFLVVDGVVPTVSVEGTALDAGAVMAPAGDCAELEVAGLSVQRCTTLVATVPQAGASVGRPDIAVTNPTPAGCTDTRNDLVEVIGGPTISSAAPSLVCTEDQGRDVVITGTGFLRVDTVPASSAVIPEVMIGGSTIAPGNVAISGCATAVEINGLSYESCTTLTASVPQSTLSAGMPAVVVTNPDPAGCTVSDSTVLTVPPTLAISSPPNVCQGVSGNQVFSLSGAGFLRVGSDDPSVDFDSGSQTPTPTLSDCSELTVDGVADVFSCDTLEVTIDVTGLTDTPGSTYPLAIDNDHVAACPLTTSVDLTVVQPPTVSSIEILDSTEVDRVCSGDGFTLRVTGTEFAAGVAVSLDSDNESIEGTVNLISDTEMEVTFSSGLTFDPSDASYDLIVENAGNCATPPIVDAIQVDAIPLVFFVDPPVVYNGVSIDVTVFTAGLSAAAAIETLELIDPTTMAATELSVVETPRPNRIVANVPVGLAAYTEPYDVRVTSQTGCVSQIPGKMRITDTLQGVTLTSVDPSFVSPTRPTAVSIEGTGFSPVPRLYLTPAAGGGTARALRAVEVESGTALTAIVPGDDAAPLAGAGIHLTASGGTYDTLFSGGETLDLTIDGESINVVFAGTDQTLAQVVAAINVESNASALGADVASEEDGELRLDSTITGPAAQVRVEAGSTAAATLGFMGLPVESLAGDVVYDLILVAPNGDVAIAEDAITAVVNEPPRIDQVTPASLPSNEDGSTLVTVSGVDFDTGGVDIVLECDSAGTINTVSGVGETVLDEETATVFFDLATGTPGAPPAGSVCLLTLTNGDGASFVYSAISITNSSFNLSVWNASTDMNAARRGPVLEAARPTRTSRFLHVVGGDSGDPNPLLKGAVLTSAESASVSVLGEMGSWSDQRNDLSNVAIGGASQSLPRTQAASAAIGDFVYLFGGFDGSEATSTLLRSQVLDPLDAPEPSDLDAVLGDGVSGLGGDVGCDAVAETCLYYYRVAAIFPADDANNPGGESLASELLPVELPDISDKIVLTLAWEPVAGAHGYRIYRTPVAGAGPDAVELLAEQVCGAGANDVCDCGANPGQCHFEDDGSLTTTGQTPMPSGALGVWHAVDQGNRCDGTVGITGSGGQFDMLVALDTLELVVDGTPLTVTFTGLEMTVGDVIAAINLASNAELDIGTDIASDDGGELRLESPSSGAGAELSVVGGLAAATLGFPEPVDASADCELSARREGHASALVQDPSDPDTWYIYAAGGRDESGAYLSSYEYAVVTVAPDGSQQVSDWTLGSDALVSPRADLAGWVMRANNSALIRASVPDEVWVYFGAGRNTGGDDGRLDAGELQAGGDLGTFTTEGDFGSLVGLAAGSANDQLYTFGGVSGQDGSSLALCGSPPANMGGCSVGVPDPPDLTNPNGLGPAATVQRQFPGYTQESAFFFLVGGHSGGAALLSTEQTVQ